MLDNFSSPLISIHAEDEIPKNCSNADTGKTRNRSQSETGGSSLSILVLFTSLKESLSVSTKFKGFWSSKGTFSSEYNTTDIR